MLVISLDTGDHVCRLCLQGARKRKVVSPLALSVFEAERVLCCAASTAFDEWTEEGAEGEREGEGEGAEEEDEEGKGELRTSLFVFRLDGVLDALEGIDTYADRRDPLCVASTGYRPVLRLLPSLSRVVNEAEGVCLATGALPHSSLFALSTTRNEVLFTDAAAKKVLVPSASGRTSGTLR